MHRKLVLVSLAIAGLLGGCDYFSAGNVASVPSEPSIEVPRAVDEQRTVSCKTPEALAQRTAVVAIEVVVRTQYEFGLDEKSHTQLRYPVSAATPVAAYAVTQGGTKILLPNVEIGEGEDWSSPSGGCKNFSFAAVGQYMLVNHFIGTGNPYPYDQNWFVHRATQQVVEAEKLIQDMGYLELVTPDCLMSTVRGDASSPGQRDKWCKVDGGSTFKRVAGVMSLDDHDLRDSGRRGNYWFGCDRSSGLGQASEKIQMISRTEVVDVSDSGISASMDRQCQAWAKDPNAY